MMQKIINQNQKFVRRVVSEDEAREAMKDEPYKLELLGRKNDAADAGEGVNVEVGAGDITIYDNVDRKSGDSVWCDLCRGPHLPNTKLISNAFALTRSSAAYWLGNQNNQQLQRIYGTAWPTKDALKAYQERIAEAERRDHRKLGAELDLFSFPDELGSGLPVFHPKGGIIRKAMEDYSRQRHVDAGYEFVYTPHITKGHLYEVSGHLDWYKEGMFPAMHIDAELNEDGTVRKPGQDYYLKPMNCPMHNLIFRSRGRSYRELPLRLFEFGSVYRYEKSGVVHGLTRVRGMTQDDAHIYCTREQMKDELTTHAELRPRPAQGLRPGRLLPRALHQERGQVCRRRRHLGGSHPRPSPRWPKPPGSSSSRIRAEPRSTAPRSPSRPRTRSAAPGRCPPSSSTSTCPSASNSSYQAADGTRQRPVMIHRALFGSVERFMGVLTEHYAGAFPAWLAPVQVVGIPVAEAFNDYMFDVVDQLKAAGIRAEVDISSDRFPKKIRTASKDKIPFVLIAGGDDAEAGAVSFRFRDGSQDNGVPVAEAVAADRRRCPQPDQLGRRKGSACRKPQGPGRSIRATTP